jgi:hypothetical protein
MTRTARAAVGAAGLALGTLPLLVPIAVAASTRPPTKAQVEHYERSARTAHPTKAQIERDEHARASSGPGQPSAAGGGSAPSILTGPNGSDAAAWQLALSAALGAAVTGGGVLLASRHVNQHRHAVAQ